MANKTLLSLIAVPLLALAFGAKSVRAGENAQLTQTNQPSAVAEHDSYNQSVGKSYETGAGISQMGGLFEALTAFGILYARDRKRELKKIFRR